MRPRGTAARINWPASLAWLLATALIAIIIGLFSGCTSDRQLVTNALAARHYHDGRYRRECVSDRPVIADPVVVAKAVAIEVIGDDPASCESFRKLVNAALDETELANGTQKIGKLPKTARRRLRRLMREMENHE